VSDAVLRSAPALGRRTGTRRDAAAGSRSARASRPALWLTWAILQCLPANGAVAADATGERWFEMLIGAVPAGYLREALDAGEHDLRRTTTESVIVINRLETRVEIRELSVAVEDPDGHLTQVHSEVRASKDPTVLDLTVTGAELTIATEAGGRRYQRRIHEPRALLGPEGIRALTAQRLAAGADTVGYATFVAELGSVSGVTRRLIGREPATEDHGARYVVEETLEAMPTPARLWLDVDGRVVEESVNGPFGEMRTVLASAAVRDRVLNAGPLPQELYAGALVHSNVRLPEPRSIDRLRVRIDLKRPDRGFPDLEGPDQHVLERAADHVVLEVGRAPQAEGTLTAEAAEPDTQPNFILQSDDPAVLALARSLRRPGAGPYAQARLLQDWVAGHMRFDAGLTMLPASEVVRDRGGTCVAYAVLLTSLARALGIPARMVMGYVYVGNIWGGHAWTEIRVGRRWIPLDAAVYRPGPADAARIAVVRHAGELGAASGAAELGQLFGNESIRVLGYRRGGAWVTVPADAAPYQIDGDRYQNRWLGLRLDKPAGYRFTQADASYPDSTVIALVAPDGGGMRLRQAGTQSARVDPAAWLRAAGYPVDRATAVVAGRRAWRATQGSRSAVAFRDGLDLWLLEADGADAMRDLDAVASRLELRPAAH
jgi:hypothetical protein